MTFKQYRDSLRAKKYAPIPQAETNALVIAGKDLDRVSNSLQRLIMKSISKFCNFDATPDDILFELVQVSNLAIAEAFHIYKHDGIDFAYFAYIHIKNALRQYGRSQLGVVKSSQVNGEFKYASYLHIDAPSDDEDVFDIPVQPEEIMQEIDLKLIFKLIKEDNKLFKQKYFEIYAAYMGLSGDEPKKMQDVAHEFGITNQRVSQIVADVAKNALK